MKKLFLFCSIVYTFSLFSQSEVTTHKFDLESIGRHKGWGFYTGYKNENNEIIIKIGQAICSEEKEVKTPAYLYSFKGLKWNFEELVFDNDFNFLQANKKDFPSTVDALNYEQVWGEKFTTITPTGASSPFTKEFIGKKTVIPSFGFGAKLLSGYIYGKRGGGINRGAFGNAGVGCSELPDFNQTSSATPVSAKGEVWTGIRGFPIIGGGVAFYHVGGTYKEKELIHYVLNKYDEKLNVVKSLVFDFDYTNMAQIVSLKIDEGKWDYVIVLQTSDKLPFENIRLEEADMCEIIYVDGETFEEKFRTQTNLPFTNWFIRNAEIGQDGSIYLFGPAGKNNEKYMPAPCASYVIADTDLGPNSIVNNSKSLPNYQIARIKDGKVFNITGTDTDLAETKVNVLEGSKIKTSKKPLFNIASENYYSVWDPYKISKDAVKYYFKNSKIIMCFQPFESRNPNGTYEHGNLVTAIFDANGALESYIIKPEKNFSYTDEFFSATNKMMYIAYYDLEELNTKISDGVYMPNKIPHFIGANLHFTKIDINTYTNKTESLEILGTNEWAVLANNPVLTETDDEIVFLGKNIAKNLKDSDLLFIRVKK